MRVVLTATNSCPSSERSRDSNAAQARCSSVIPGCEVVTPMALAQSGPECISMIVSPQATTLAALLTSMELTSTDSSSMVMTGTDRSSMIFLLAGRPD
jgi:hypothetical protein